MPDSSSERSLPVPGDSPSRWGLWGLLKRLLFLIVLGWVLWQIWQLGGKVDWSQTQLHPGWLAGAMMSYLLGWIPCVWYWRALLVKQGYRLPWSVAIRSHYLGQLGKYVPGKAAALLIRAETIRSAEVPLIVGLLTAGFESLATMAVGGCVAVALSPHLLSNEQWTRLGIGWMTDSWGKWGIGLFVIAITVLLIPCLSGLLNLILQKIAGKVVKGDTNVRAVEPSRWSFLALVLTWWLHGLSLGCTIQCVGYSGPLLLNWPLWTGITALGTVLGFVVLFAPGGAGVREGVLLSMLQGSLGPQAAIVVVLLRLIWLVSELMVAGLCLLLGSGRVRKVKVHDLVDSSCSE